MLKEKWKTWVELFSSKANTSNLYLMAGLFNPHYVLFSKAPCKIFLLGLLQIYIKGNILDL